MPYTPLNWVAGVTPLSEFNLDHLETQYDQAVADIGKEIFVPVGAGGNTGAARVAVQGDFPAIQCNQAGERVYLAFQVPRDFTTLIAAEIIVIPTATKANANWDIDSDYGAEGEAYNNHSEADAASTYNVTNNQIFAVDISGILSAIVANDYVGIKFTQVDAGDNVDVVGIRLRYS